MALTKTGYFDGLIKKLSSITVFEIVSKKDQLTDVLCFYLKRMSKFLGPLSTISRNRYSVVYTFTCGVVGGGGKG